MLVILLLSLFTRWSFILVRFVTQYYFYRGLSRSSAPEIDNKVHNESLLELSWCHRGHERKRTTRETVSFPYPTVVESRRKVDVLGLSSSMMRHDPRTLSVLTLYNIFDIDFNQDFFSFSFFRWLWDVCKLPNRVLEVTDLKVLVVFDWKISPISISSFTRRPCYLSFLLLI